MTTVASAQRPNRPGDVRVADEEKSQQPVQNSDAHRIVGKVVRIDRVGKLVALATTEGEVTVPAPERTIRAIRVGDTITVPRPDADFPSASPRDRKP